MSTGQRIKFARRISDLILKAFNERGICVAIFWFHRTENQQQALYAIGRTVELHKKPVTNCDGIIKRSKHQDWEAADLCIIDPKTGEWQWSRIPEYDILGRLAKELELAWGGDWDGDEIRDPNDYDCFHFELAKSGD